VKKKRKLITGRWTERIYKIKGVNKRVKVRRWKGKVQVRVIDKKRKLIKTINKYQAKEHFRLLPFRSKVLDVQKRAKKTYKQDAYDIPESYLKKDGHTKFDIEGVDTPKKYKVPRGLKIKSKVKNVYGHTVRGKYFDDHGEVIHNTTVHKFSMIAQDKVLKTSSYNSARSVSFSVDPKFTQFGNVSLVFHKNKMKKLKPVTYYNCDVYSRTLSKKNPKGEEHLRVEKGVYTDRFYEEREWFSREPVKITKSNLKKIIYFSSAPVRPTKEYLKKHPYWSPDEKREEVRKIAKQLGVKFETKRKK